MKYINPLMIVGLCIHVFLTFIFWLDTQDSIILWICLPFVLLNIIGLILIVAEYTKLGATLFLIGSIPFAPIGLIGAFGARKLLNALKEDEFLKTL